MYITSNDIIHVATFILFLQNFQKNKNKNKNALQM
jgi:hypothetical protein